MSIIGKLDWAGTHWAEHVSPFRKLHIVVDHSVFGTQTQNILVWTKYETM